MDRRCFTKGFTAGCAALLAASTPASRAQAGGNDKMTLAACRMPPEDAPHEHTLMQWPVRETVYGRKLLSQVQDSIVRIATAVARFEPVSLMAAAPLHAQIKTRLEGNVELWDIATDDLWCRDSGPTVVKDANGRRAVAHIAFNGWGNKQSHGNDGAVAAKAAARLNMPLLASGLTGEQGGIESDGEGTLLALASCWVNENRNRGSQDEIGAKLLAALGGRKIIWAPGIKGADITDYHIDALARFVAPGRVLIQLPARVIAGDRWSKAAYETYEILKRATDADGRKLDIIVVPEPVAPRVRAEDFVASYVNYYVCNGAVISAQFGDDASDQKAYDLLRGLYPGREIVALNIDPIGRSGGGIHCATQQVPL